MAEQRDTDSTALHCHGQVPVERNALLHFRTHTRTHKTGRAANEITSLEEKVRVLDVPVLQKKKRSEKKRD